MSRNMIIHEKSFNFAVKIVSLYKIMVSEQREFVLSKQLLRSGTSIGANVREAKYAQSVADMISKYSIARKEANETCYWLELLKATNYLDQETYDRLNNECVEMLKILTVSIKSLEKKEDNK